MAITEGVAAGVAPSDGSSTPKFMHGHLMPSNSLLYFPRLDNTTAFNVKVAIYDSLGNPLLIADDAAFTVATSRVLPVGFLADEVTPDSVDEGDIGAARMTLARILYSTPGGFTAGRAVADTQIKGSAGFVHAVSIAPLTAIPTAGLLTIYDSLTETGTVLYAEWIFATAPGHTVTLDLPAATGIYVGFDATLANVQVSVSYR